MNKIATVSVHVFLLILPLLAVAPLLYASDPAVNYTAHPGPYQVDAVCCEWNDTLRDREVPVKIYFPLKGDGPFPLIIFSHGLGGSREGYEYLGRHWASYGYVSLHLQHPGSDYAVWQNTSHAMETTRKALREPGNALNRARDVSFAIDEMQKMNRESEALKGRIDLQNIGMAGDSFGAWTTLAVAGEVFIAPKGGEATLADPRVKAAIAMSAPAPVNKDQLDKTFAKITIPCLHMTGTLDDSPVGDTKAVERRVPFDHIRGPDQYLITFEGGDHMIFAGSRARPQPPKKDDLFHDLICISSTAFWDAYLKQSDSAKKWISQGEFKTLLGQEGSFEKKEKVLFSRDP